MRKRHEKCSMFSSVNRAIGFLDCFLWLCRVHSYALNLLVTVICVLQRHLPREVPVQLVIPLLLLAAVRWKIS